MRRAADRIVLPAGDGDERLRHGAWQRRDLLEHTHLEVVHKERLLGAARRQVVSLDGDRRAGTAERAEMVDGLDEGEATEAALMRTRTEAPSAWHGTHALASPTLLLLTVRTRVLLG